MPETVESENGGVPKAPICGVGWSIDDRAVVPFSVTQFNALVEMWVRKENEQTITDESTTLATLCIPKRHLRYLIQQSSELGPWVSESGRELLAGLMPCAEINLEKLRNFDAGR